MDNPSLFLYNDSVTTQPSSVVVCGGVFFGGFAPKKHTPTTSGLSSYRIVNNDSQLCKSYHF